MPSDSFLQPTFVPPATQIPLTESVYPSASVFKLDLYVYEMAARILFYIVHWLRSIKEFQLIPAKDQVRCSFIEIRFFSSSSRFQLTSLLHCWHEIFLLSLCEYKFDVPWINLMHSGQSSEKRQIRSARPVCVLLFSRSIE